MTDKPVNETLFELYSLKQWGDKYGWEAVEGLLGVRIGVYEEREKGGGNERLTCRC